MKRTILALSLAFGISVGSGCAGFGSGFVRGITGAPPDVTQTDKPGYDWGVLAANLVVALTGYFGRYAQEKLTSGKNGALKA